MEYVTPYFSDHLHVLFKTGRCGPAGSRPSLMKLQHLVKSNNLESTTLHTCYFLINYVILDPSGFGSSILKLSPRFDYLGCVAAFRIRVNY